MAEVRLRNVTKVFGKVVAVKNFTLDIKDGEFIILVGPSGCGKTTTLRTIAGLEEVTSGEIYIGDRLVNDVPPKNRDIAMVFQNYALYPHMDVYKNMAFGLKLRKVPKDEIDRIVKRTAELLGIRELLDRKPKELSGGQRQRVALGRAIVRNPKVFLFDEPLSNLDAKLRIAMRAELLDLHQNEGLIQQVDSPQNVYDHPINKYVASFIGSPAMNFIDCVITKKNGNLYATSKGMSLRIPKDKAKLVEKYINKEAILGLRPEHISDTMTVKDYEPETTFKASIWVVEPLGSEKLVHIRNENDTLVARLDPHVTLQTGDVAEFTARMDLAHIFDKETEETIF